MLIGKEEIRRLIPHAGSMCLIDAVSGWDAEAIFCVTGTHRDPSHPLRRDGQLAAVHAFEYAAQAAAIHGALLAGAADRPPTVGYLGTLRHAHLAVARLDTISDDLEVSARLLFGDGANAIYTCDVTAAGIHLAEVRISIIERPRSDVSPGDSCKGERCHDA